MTEKTELRREFLQAMDQYLSYLKSNYYQWTQSSYGISPEIQDQMIRDYAESLRYKKDKVYTRVVVRDSVHSFIVMQDSGKLKRGDILRAVTRTKPDKTFVRGNVLECRYYAATWAGV